MKISNMKKEIIHRAIRRTYDGYINLVEDEGEWKISWAALGACDELETARFLDGVANVYDIAEIMNRYKIEVDYTKGDDYPASEMPEMERKFAAWIEDKDFDSIEREITK